MHTSIWKKTTAFLASLTIAVALLPVAAFSGAVQQAWAGGSGPDISGLVQGLESDKTVNVGSTVFVTMASLDGAYGDFSSRYSSGDTSVAWSVGTSFAEDDHEDFKGVLKDGKFSYVVKSADAGKLLWFSTDSKTDTGYNNNTVQFKINEGAALVYTPDFEVEEVTSGSEYAFKLKTTPSLDGSWFDMTLQKLSDDATTWQDVDTKKVSYLTTSVAYSASDFAGLTYDVVYRLKIVSSLSKTAFSDVFVLTKKTSSSGGSGSSSSGSSSSSTGKPASVKAPKVTKFSVATDVMYATCTVEFQRGTVDSGSGYASTSDATYVELYKNGKLVNKKAVEYYYTSTVIGIPIRYAKKDKLYVKVYNMYNGKKLGKPVTSKTVKAKSKSLGKAKQVRATKISSKQAIVRWSMVSGATGYRIYKGSKKVKQVKGSVFKTIVKGSGAGKATYRIQPILKSKLDKKTFTGKKSKTAKPKKNQATFNVSTSYKDYKYWTCPFIVKKISLSGKTYTITGYACNNRIWTMKKYKTLSINVFADGKQVVKKTLKNKRIGVKENSSKKVVIKVKGKAGADLANGGNVSRYTSVKSYWVTSSGKEV